MKTGEETNQGKPNAEAPAGAPAQAPEANQAPGVDYQKKVKELEDALKERDAKISDLTTTKATLEARYGAPDAVPGSDGDVNSRVKRILENSTYDPDNASKDLTGILSEVESKAVARAQQVIQAQTYLEKLKLGVKSSNPEFDDEVVDLIMDRANQLAQQPGKYKSAEDAVKDATTYVKSKFEAYAQKTKAVPPLPAGAAAETGGNPAPSAPKQEKIPQAEEVLEGRITAKSKKIL